MPSIKHLKNKFSIATFDLICACDGDELRFYQYLKLYAINNSNAWPSQSSIERDLGWNVQKIARLVKHMESLNRLTVERKNGKNNIYDITWYDSINNGLTTIKNDSGGEMQTPIENDGATPIKNDSGTPIKIDSQTNSNKLSEINNTPAEPAKVDWDESDLVAYLNRMREDKNRATQLIGFYLAMRGVGVQKGTVILRNKLEMQAEIRRHVRAANQLLGVYTWERIEECIMDLTEHAKFNWTLETVIKKISLSREERVRSLGHGQSIYTR